MSTVVTTIALIFVAGFTAGLWLNLIMWIPMLIVGAVVDTYDGLGIVMVMSMFVAAAVVFTVGFAVLGLPWYAAAIAGAVIGMTSYARPNPAAQSQPAWYD